jgi:hypothetical protein
MTARLLWAGLGAWLVFLVAIVVLVILHPHQHTVVQPYRDGAFASLAGVDMYGPGIHGFLYLPSFAVIFLPFAWLGSPLGDLVWRAVGLAVLAAGVVRLARLLGGGQARLVLGVALLAGLPASASAVQNGQATVVMIGLMIHATVDIAAGRAWRPGLLLGLAVGIKPLALVMALLTAAVWPRLRLPVLTGLALVLAIPFLRAHPAIAIGQYVAAWGKLTIASDPGIGDWSDLTMLLTKAGLRPPGALMTVLRIAAALGAVALAAWAGRRLRLADAAFSWLLLSCLYLLLMNPRTQEDAYLMLALPAALLAGRYFFVERRLFEARGLLLLCLALGSQAYGDLIFRPTELWLKPLLALLFAGYLIDWIRRGASAGVASSGAASAGAASSKP